MNLNLVSKDKQGELHVSFLWISLLIIFVGFLFGLGFAAAYVFIDAIYNGDGFYLYYFIKEYRVVILISVVLYIVYSLHKQDKENKK